MDYAFTSVNGNKLVCYDDETYIILWAQTLNFGHVLCFKIKLQWRRDFGLVLLKTRVPIDKTINILFYYLHFILNELG